MALYSLNEEDSLKVSIRFPADSSVERFYDYVTEIRDLAGRVITKSLAINYITRIEIIVPNCTLTFIQKPSMKLASQSNTIIPKLATNHINITEKYWWSMRPIPILFLTIPICPPSKMPWRNPRFWLYKNKQPKLSMQPKSISECKLFKKSSK